MRLWSFLFFFSILFVYFLLYFLFVHFLLYFSIILFLFSSAIFFLFSYIIFIIYSCIVFFRFSYILFSLFCSFVFVPLFPFPFFSFRFALSHATDSEGVTQCLKKYLPDTHFYKHSHTSGSTCSNRHGREACIV